MNGFGPDDRLQPTHNRVDASEHEDDRHPVYHGYAKQALDYLATGKERKTKVTEDGIAEREQDQPISAATAVALFQEIGQRRNATANIERHEEDRQNNQRDGGHHLRIAVEQTPLVAFLGQADQLQCGDVGGEQRESNGRPGQCSSGKKVACAPRLPPLSDAGCQTQGHNAHQIDNDNNEVDPAYLQLIHCRVLDLKQMTEGWLRGSSQERKNSLACIRFFSTAASVAAQHKEGYRPDFPLAWA